MEGGDACARAACDEAQPGRQQHAAAATAEGVDEAHLRDASGAAARPPCLPVGNGRHTRTKRGNGGRRTRGKAGDGSVEAAAGRGVPPNSGGGG